jgi:hypothetical protein
MPRSKPPSRLDSGVSRASGASSISSLSQSSRPSSIKKNTKKRKGKQSPPAKGKRHKSKRDRDKENRQREHEEFRKILERGWKGSDDESTSDEDDVYDNMFNTKKKDDVDFVPVTSTAEEQRLIDHLNPVLLAMIERHRKIFMAKAFPPVQDDAADYMLWCHPQEEVDYIIHVLSNWQEGVQLKQVPPGPEKDRLATFRRENKLGKKYIKKYSLEVIQPPGGDPCTVVCRKEKGHQVGRIVVSRESAFDAIDEWHRQSGHLGQERTWTFCKSKYYNVSQPLVKIYCETCYTCAQKNPVTKPQKGSRKPIISRSFRQRFQIDLIDMRKLQKRDPFGVMMRWIMTVKGHATGFTYICVLPRKRPSLIAYRLQEVFGLIGYPSIFHTDNGKEFTAKVILQFLRQLNPNILSVTGRPRRPNDQGSVESMNKLV